MRDAVPLFRVRVWNAYLLVNSHIKISKDHRTITYNNKPLGFHRSGFQQIRGVHTSNYIKPLKLKSVVNPKPFYTADIETISINGLQYPVQISFIGSKISKLFIIRNTIDINLQVDKLWFEFISYINNNLS